MSAGGWSGGNKDTYTTNRNGEKDEVFILVGGFTYGHDINRAPIEGALWFKMATSFIPKANDDDKTYELALGASQRAFLKQAVAKAEVQLAVLDLSSTGKKRTVQRTVDIRFRCGVLLMAFIIIVITCNLHKSYSKLLAAICAILI